MPPLRVALFLPNLDGGGAERVMVNLARGFAERGLRVDVVLATARGAYAFDVPRDVQIIELRASRVSTSLPRLIRYLRRERPATVISTLRTSNLIAILATRLARVGTRTVIRQAVTLSADSRGTDRGILKIIPLLVPHVYRWADEIIAVSEGVAKDLAAATHVPRERIRVVPNPVVTTELLAQARESPAHPWLAPGHDPLILGVGRLATQKDFSTLIRAFATVRQKRCARLVILGEGDQRPLLEALIKQLLLQDSVSLPGFVRNPFAYMARAAVFVLSSLWEGMPGVLIQALACGAPVIATDCESGPREILKNGRFGRLVPPGDAEAIASAIVDTLDHPSPRVPEDAWRAFAQDAAVEAYLRVVQPHASTEALPSSNDSRA